MIMAVSEQYLVDSEGRRTAVLLSLEHYQKLMEDLHDLAVVAERREEKAISLQELKRRLKKDGLL
jgi:PHD/YefM family antitoxin component YafN of YafNO toxin-antitoxin module